MDKKLKQRALNYGFTNQADRARCKRFLMHG